MKNLISRATTRFQRQMFPKTRYFGGHHIEFSRHFGCFSNLMALYNPNLRSKYAKSQISRPTTRSQAENFHFNRRHIEVNRHFFRVSAQNLQKF